MENSELIHGGRRIDRGHEDRGQTCGPSILPQMLRGERVGGV